MGTQCNHHAEVIINDTQHILMNFKKKKKKKRMIIPFFSTVISFKVIC